MKKFTTAIFLLLTFLLLVLSIGNIAPVMALSKVTTSNIAYPLEFPFQRKLFYAQGNVWAFPTKNYLGGSFTFVVSSSDGVSWGTPVETDLSQFGTVWENGSHVFIITDYEGGYLRFQLGELVSDGSINLGPERTIVSWLQAWYCYITVDSDGYPWAIATNGSLSNPTTACVFKANDVSGASWSSPTVLFSVSARAVPVILPLADGNLYALCKDSSGNFTGRLYNGTDWEAEEVILEDDGSAFYVHYSAVVDVNYNIHVVYENDSDRSIHYMIRTSTWNAPQTLAISQGSYCDPHLTVDGEDLYVAWMKGANLYVMRRRNGEWKGPSFLVTSGGYYVGGSLGTLHSFYKAVNHKIGYLWADPPKPYDIWYQELEYDLNLRAVDVQGNPVPNAEVTISASPSQTKTTSADGWANFTVAPDSEVSIKVVVSPKVIYENALTIDWFTTTDVECNIALGPVAKPRVYQPSSEETSVPLPPMLINVILVSTVVTLLATFVLLRRRK